MGYAIDVAKAAGDRISNLTHLKTGQAIEPRKSYVVAGWASINEGTQGPPIWDVLRSCVSAQKTVQLKENTAVRVSGT
jgi:sulfur-oxidizing protein SoxB